MVPLRFVPGLAALLFKELVLVVAGIVLISLLVALTLTPLLTLFFLPAAYGLAMERRQVVGVAENAQD